MESQTNKSNDPHELITNIMCRSFSLDKIDDADQINTLISLASCISLSSTIQRTANYHNKVHYGKDYFKENLYWETRENAVEYARKNGLMISRVIISHSIINNQMLSDKILRSFANEMWAEVASGNILVTEIMET